MSLKGNAYWIVETKGNIVGRLWWRHILHDAEVVAHYEIIDSYVLCMDIQTDWDRPCNINQRTTG